MTKKIKQAVDDLYVKYANTLSMLDSALDQIDELEKELDKKPKEVIVEKLVEKEIPVEIEKIVEVERKVEVPKEVVVTVEKEVPGPERIVEVPGPERVVEKIVEKKIKIPVPNTEAEIKLKKKISELEIANKEIEKLKKQLNKKPKVVEVEKIVEVEKEIPVEVEKEASGDLKEAARLMAQSEFNKEDLSERQIFKMLQKSSEEEVKKKIGFWAMPLPTDDANISPTNKKYTGRRR